MPANFKQEEINLREVVNEVCGLNEKVAENTQGIAENTSTLQNYAGRNLLINGDFSVWQRGTSFGGDEFNADRWYTSSTVSSVVRSENVPDDLRVKYAIQLTATAATVDIRERIEGVENFKIGQTYTISFYLEGNSDGQDITVAGVFREAGWGNPVVDFGGVVGQVSDTYTRYEYTFTVTKAPAPTSTSYVLNIYVQNYTGDIRITGIQLELGSVATPFEYVDPATQLARCQRYYERINASDAYTLFGMGACKSNTETNCIVNFTPKRDIPTCSASGSFIVMNDSALGTACTIGVIGVSTLSSTDVGTTGSSGLAAGNATRLFSSNDTNAYIEVESEL